MEQPPLDLSRIRIVLVEPLYGGNIGQVARAMMNFGLDRLALVRPREHLTAESYWMARDGKKILEDAAVHPSLESALEGVHLAVGTTRRVGKYRRPCLTPEEMASELAPLSAGNVIALVFGREDSGLSASELKLCQWLVTIPANPAFPSLNLAQAVLLMGYVLYRGSLGRQDALPPEFASPQLAGPALLERFYQHLESTLDGIGFLTGDHAPSILVSLRRIFGRANLDPRDVAILRGILGQMDWYRENSTVPTALAERRARTRPLPPGSTGGTGEDQDPGGD